MEEIRVASGLIWIMGISGVLVAITPICILWYLKNYMEINMAPILLGFACYVAFSMVLANIAGQMTSEIHNVLAHTGVMTLLLTGLAICAIFVGLRSLNKPGTNSSTAFLFAAGYTAFEAWNLAIGHFTKAAMLGNINTLLMDQTPQAQEEILEQVVSIASMSYFDNLVFALSGIGLVFSIFAITMLVWMYVRGNVKVLALVVAIGGMFIIKALHMLNQNGLIAPFLTLLTIGAVTVFIFSITRSAYNRYLNDIKLGKQKGPKKPDIRDVL